MRACENASGFADHNGGVLARCCASDGGASFEEVGGLVSGNSSTGSVASSFYDVETTGLATSNGGTGLHTAEMQTAQTYLDAGWDFVGIWMICEGMDYPRLQWEHYDCQDDR